MHKGGVTPKPVANNAPTDPVPMLMTRPHASSQAFVDQLPPDLRAQVTPVYSPLIGISGLDHGTVLDDGDAAIFTSSNGVAHGPEGRGRRAFCVGSATTQAAQQAGWRAEMRGISADAFVTDLLQDPPNGRLVHMSGTHTRGNIAARLSAHGMQVENVAVYDQVAQKLSTEALALLASGRTTVVPLFSPRTARIFSREAQSCSRAYVIALSKAVAQNLERTSYATVALSSAPDSCAMRAAIAAVLSDLPAG